MMKFKRGLCPLGAEPSFPGTPFTDHFDQLEKDKAPEKTRVHHQDEMQSALALCEKGLALSARPSYFGDIDGEPIPLSPLTGEDRLSAVADLKDRVAPLMAQNTKTLGVFKNESNFGDYLNRIKAVERLDGAQEYQSARAPSGAGQAGDAPAPVPFGGGADGAQAGASGDGGKK